MLLPLVALIALALPGESPPPERPLLASVAVVGASVTAGFRSKLEYEFDSQAKSTSFDFASVLEAMDRTGAGTFHSFGDPYFYADPMKKGPALIEKVLAKDPTMVVAIDFLFWFSYGGKDREGAPIESREQRLLKLEEGLALLAPIECTLVLGDLADMSPAIGKMLMPGFVPDGDTLAISNGRIHEWAVERENVIMLPLAKTVGRIQANEKLRIGEHEWPAGSRKVLLHEDRLHSTVYGLIALAQLVVARLDDAGLVDQAVFELGPRTIQAGLRARATETARQLAANKESKAPEAVPK